MKRLIEFFIKQHLFGDLLTVFVIAFGIYAALNIRREVFPNVNFDVISVVTLFPGASPDEVEKLVTNPLEQEIKEVDGIKRLQSNSTDNRSGIVVWLDPDQTTAADAKVDIQDAVDRTTDLPEDAEDPLVTSIESKQTPIIEVALGGEIPEMELRNLAKNLEEEIERVPGVARVAHRALRDLEFRVEADSRELSRYRLSLDDLVRALKGQNVSIPGGVVEVTSIDPKAREKVVRTVGEFKTAHDVEQTVVRANELGEPIRVKDVAKVSLTLEKATVITRTNGHPSLNLTVLKKEKADAITVVQAVRKRVDELRPRFDARVSLTFMNDFSYFVERRLSILTGNLVIGLGMVLLMLPLMIPFRFSVIIAMGEPFAFLGTILLLYAFGQSINLISMIGLIIVAGILVDDSIVVTENAVRLVEEGMDPKEAAAKGAAQIFAPVTASVCTTLTAFAPMAFMSGIFGKFIVQIPIAVSAALIVSLIETYFVLPGHIANWIKPGQAKLERGGAIGRFLDASRNFWDRKIVPFYIYWLKVALVRRYWVTGLLAVLFVASILLATRGMKFILFPAEGVEIFFVRTEAPTATSLNRHASLLQPIEKAIAELPKQEVDSFTASIGIQQQDPNDPNTRRGSEYAQITVFLTPETQRNRSAAEIIEGIRKKVGTPEGLKRVVYSRVNPGPPVGKPISLGVRASQYEDIMPAVAYLKEVLGKFDGVTDIEDNYTLGKEELRVSVDSAQASAAGLNVAGVGGTVRAAFEGLVATTVRELSEEIDVRVSLASSQRTDERAINDILIPNMNGNLIPLSQIASIKRTQGLSIYEHEGNQRQVKVTAEVNTDVTTSTEVNARLQAMLPELNQRFPKVKIAFGGEAEDTEESLKSLVRAFTLAVAGIFLILVLTFRSLLQPIVVLLTIPLGVIAVIWAFFLHGLPFSFMGMLGIIALGGVIVNNAIVLVDFVNQAREEGMEKMESIIQGATTRIRPIFLTTATTVIGILPTAYGIGGLDKFVVPIAMALGWGLMFGSILTAFVFPSALAILDDLKAFTARRFGGGKAHA